MILFCYIALPVHEWLRCRSLRNNWHLRDALLAADWCFRQIQTLIFM